MYHKEGENSQSVEIIKIIAKSSAGKCYWVKKGDVSLLRFTESFDN